MKNENKKTMTNKNKVAALLAAFALLMLLPVREMMGQGTRTAYLHVTIVAQGGNANDNTVGIVLNGYDTYMIWPSEMGRKVEDEGSSSSNNYSKPFAVMISTGVQNSTNDIVCANGNRYYGLLDESGNSVSATRSSREPSDYSWCRFNVSGYKTGSTSGSTNSVTLYAHFSRPINGITADNVTLGAGSSGSVTYTLTASGGSGEFYNNVVATSSKPAVFTVGTVTNNLGDDKSQGSVAINAVGVGTATLTLTARKPDGTTIVTKDVTIVVENPVTLTVEPESITGMVDLEERTFTVRGTCLSSKVTVTPPAGFQIKQGSGSWSSSAIDVSGTSVNEDEGVTFSVRMSGSGSHSGDIRVETTLNDDVTLSKTISVSGTVADNWFNEVADEPYPYSESDINAPDAFVWCLKQNHTATLTADIDLSGHPWVPIANYTGTFDGNGHVITGLTNKNDEETAVTDPGLFANITSGTVKNIIVKNCDLQGTEGTKYYGIIANTMTGGTVSGCMVVSGSLSGSGMFGGIVGQLNGGTVHSCISQVAPASGGSIVHTISGGLLRNSFTNAGSKLYINRGREDSNVQNCIYKEGSWMYVKPDGSEAAISIQGFGYGEKGCVIESDENTRLVDILNKYAKANSQTLWAQPLTKNINSGVPVMKMEGNNTVVQYSDHFDYGDLSDFISDENLMLFYGSKEYNATTSYTEDNLYIDEDAALKVTGEGSVNAHTSRFIVGGQWHHYASPVAAQPLGISYHDPGNSGWDESNGPYFNPEDYNGLFPVNAASWDLYCFYEPDYHWINFKRNTGNHWHSDDPTININYTNETNLTPGKGYLVAMGESGYVQATGNLNHGDVTITVNVSNLSATPGAKLQGFNLIGNPYQSCLSFQAFANGNTSLWDGTTATYLTYEPEGDYYTQGTVTTASSSSAAASGDISMHQGFFIVSDIVPDPEVTYKATFTNDMCSVNPEGDVHFRGEKYAYPLINLVARDTEGLGDVAVVEFDRPEFAAAPKIFNYGGKGKVFFRYEDNDNALLFLDEETDQLPVRFAAFEDGNYTIEWSTANADFSYLHLIDNMTGNDIDMLARDSYSFAAKTTDYTSRFRLVFSYTGVGEENVTEPARTFAFVHDGNLVVNGQGHMQVIDLNGRTIVTKQLTGEQNTVGLPNVAPGIYVIRLANEKESNVQKIIIK